MNDRDHAVIDMAAARVTLRPVRDPDFVTFIDSLAERGIAKASFAPIESLSPYYILLIQQMYGVVCNRFADEESLHTLRDWLSGAHASLVFLCADLGVRPALADAIADDFETLEQLVIWRLENMQ